MATLTRRRRDEEDEDTPRRSTRRSRDLVDEVKEDESPRRSRRKASDDMPTEERFEPEYDEDRPRRGRSRRDEEDEAPRRGRASSSRRSRGDNEDEDRPRRGSRGGRPSGRKTGGFSSYSQKRKSNSTFADEFKPESEKPVLMKFLDAEPFDVFNQHWIDEVKKGERKSYVCFDDEYFEDEDGYEDGCPLDQIGDSPSTYALWNVLDLTNPRKPEVKVWKTSVTVTDKLERLASAEKTKPLNREDIYFEVTMTKRKNKTDWDIQPVKARDLLEDFDIEPFDADELEDFEEKRFEDRKAVTSVDTWESLDALAESI